MSDREAARAETDHAEGLGHPGAEAPGRYGLLQEGHEAQEGLARSADRLVQQVEEHGSSVVSALVAPRVLVQVALEPLPGDGVVDAPDASLNQGEEALDG